MGDRQYWDRNRKELGASIAGSRNSFKAGFNFRDETDWDALNPSPEYNRAQAKKLKNREKRKSVAQGAALGFFTGAGVGGGTGALVGGGTGAVIGAIFGSVIPGPGTLLGAAVGAAIGGIGTGLIAGGAGIGVGAGVAASAHDADSTN